MSTLPARLLLGAVAALGLAACDDSVSPTERAGRQYGVARPLGNGQARTYVTRSDAAGHPVVELGIALSEGALEGLPTSGSGHAGEHDMPHELILALPEQHGTQYKLVELNWNPSGHPPAEVYGAPHFDFHFYTITKAERDAIDPSDPQWATKANTAPLLQYIPEFAAVPLPPGTPLAAAAVPKMGVHWNDMRSPELANLVGLPENFAPFTATWIIGSWDGEFIFYEPMITRDYLLAKKTAASAAVRDEVRPISVPAQYAAPGRYPTAYRMTWDAEAKEYRVALANLVARN